MWNQKAPAVKSPTIVAASPNAGTELLLFDAAGAVRGIVYHLMDEKLAAAVAHETIQRTLSRLAAKSFSTSILRSRWVGLSNSQRLEWLLSESQTITLVGDDNVVSLRARRVR